MRDNILLGLIVLLICVAIGVAAAKGYDGANAPGGSAVKGKWYNPDQGGAQPHSDAFQSTCLPNMVPCDNCIFVTGTKRGDLYDCPTGLVLICTE